MHIAQCCDGKINLLPSQALAGGSFTARFRICDHKKGYFVEKLNYLLEKINYIIKAHILSLNSAQPNYTVYFY